jgi:lipid A disaccharide synthetase
MRIAKWAKALGMKTHYYISPQIWAWKESRISAIKRDIDKMYVILPFENNFTKTTSLSCCVRWTSAHRCYSKSACDRCHYFRRENQLDQNQ